MITIIPTEELEQNSPEWLNLRSKYISATDAWGLLNGKTIQEILDSKSKSSNGFSGNYWTRRGHELEPEAKEIYSAVYQPTYNVGFVINDKYPLVGCSPDGLVNDDGMVEVKCFSLRRHYDVHKNLDPHIITQIQYQLWVTEREWNDLVLYNPSVENLKEAMFVHRFYPDKKIHKKFEDIFSKYLTDKGEHHG